MQRKWWRRRSGVRGVTASRPSLRVGVAVAVGSVAVATAAVYPLKTVAPTVSLSVVYLPAVLLVSAYWGLCLGLGTSLLSAAAFNFFQLPPVGRFTLADSRNWVALAAWSIVAAVVSTIADIARLRAGEADLRRREADLAAGLARELLAGTETGIALRAAAHRDRRGAGASVGRDRARCGRGTDERRGVIPLVDGSGRQIATLRVPADLPAETVERLRTHVAPVARGAGRGRAPARRRSG